MANFKPAMSASRQKLTWDERPLLADCVEEVGGPTVWELRGIRRA